MPHDAVAFGFERDARPGREKSQPEFPDSGDDWIYIICGDWNHVGAETVAPILNDQAFQAQFNNSGGVDGTIRLNKPIMGLGIAERCRKYWSRKDGKRIAKEDFYALADDVAPFQRVINPDAPVFDTEGGMPDKINRYLEETGQPKAESRGEFARLCLDSLVLSHRRAVGQLSDIVNRKHSVAYMLGWGSGSRLLAQMTADAIGRPVKCGPMDAKALGNIIMQAIALGDIGSLGEGRDLVAASFPGEVFEPGPRTEQSEAAYAKYLKLP